LSTALAPHLFLPLACTANLAKNLAAVAASSTRAPIYKTFALQNNLADVTAKGESVANLADVLGTICGIVLAKANLPVIPTFAVLSCGYLLASRREVDSVELPYLNRARLSYATRRYLNVGVVPAPPEANEKEPLLPWSDPNQKRIVLGATVEEACSNPLELKAALDSFGGGKNFALTYRPETKKVYVLFKQGADTMSALQGAIYAHCVLHLVNAAEGKKGEDPAAVPLRNGGAVGKLRRHAAILQNSHGRSNTNNKSNALNPGKEAIDYVAANGSEIWSQFETQSKALGWKLPLTMLNPSETRVYPV
jgi:Vitamin B6 photo-protection and homoeostasis